MRRTDETENSGGERKRQSRTEKYKGVRRRLARKRLARILEKAGEGWTRIDKTGEEWRKPENEWGM